MIITSSLVKYNTYDIKQNLSTEIKELATGGEYDYLPTPKLTLTNPVGDEIFYNSDIVQVSWYTFAWQSLDSSSLYYTFNDKDLHFISSVRNHATSSFSWDLSKYYLVDLPLTSSYKLIVSGTYISSSITDMSDIFTISTRSITILDSNVRGVSLYGNNIYPIQWETSGVGKTVDIAITHLDIESIGSINLGIIGQLPQISISASKIPLISNYEYPETKDYNFNVSASGLGSGLFYITVTDSLNPKVAGTSSLLIAVEHLITTSSGWRISLPLIKTIDAQGIYKYKEYGIEIVDDIGEAYTPRSVIELTGEIGIAYVKPRITFRPNGDGVIIGNVKS